MKERLLRLLWSIWIPDYEGGGPWHLRWRAELMYWVRALWFLGRRKQCVCPGCPEQVEKASASGLCYACATENCEHEEAFDCHKCEQPPDIWSDWTGLLWYAGCGCGEVDGRDAGEAVRKWNDRVNTLEFP